MKKEFSYFQTLSDSFKLSFQHPFIFVPLLISFLLSLIAGLFVSRSDITEPNFNFSLGLILLFVVMWIVLMAFSMIIYGWLYALVKKVALNKKLELGEDFSEGLRLAWKLFKLTLILLLVMFSVMFVIFLFGLLIGFLFALIPIVGPILAILLGLALFGLFLLLLFFLFYLTPILIMEEGGAFRTIELTINFVKNNLGHTILMGLLTILVLFISYIPLLIYQLVTMLSTILSGQTASPPAINYVLTSILSIPYLIAYVVIIFFYTLAYLKVKKR